jgi:arginase
MKIRVFELPYDSGYLHERMGNGPAALMDAGLINRLRFRGHDVSIRRIRHTEQPATEIKAAFALAGELSREVEKARDDKHFLIVLSGNCNAALGTISGLGTARTGVIWFDAHGEFNTPETTTSGFLDGMGLATATGHCWRRMAGSIHQFSRVPAQNIVLAGVRETEDEEQALIDKSGVQQIPASAIRERGIRPLLAPALGVIKRRVDQLYIHFDLDVLSPTVARWNEWTPGGGLTLEHLEEALDVLAGDPPVTAIGFASHDPTLDGERSYEAARRLLDAALAVAGA